MASIKVSVVVPVYNVEQYVSECLKSICSQTMPELEIVCIDDCGDDRSIEIAKEYAKKDQRIKIVHNPRNLGLAATRNIGIAHATGEYVGFVDSDDWLDLDFFEKLYDTAKENNADLAMGNVRRIFDDEDIQEENSWITNILYKIDKIVFDEISLRKLAIETNAVWHKIFSRQFILENNFKFFEGLDFEDNPFTVMTIIKANKICIQKDVCYYYRIHKNQISDKSIASRKPFDIFGLMQRLKSFFSEENIENIHGYQNYYIELLDHFYFNFFNYRVHKTLRREFYYKMIDEFSKLKKENVNYLLRNSTNFKNCYKQSYSSYLKREQEVCAGYLFERENNIVKKAWNWIIKK